MCDGGSADASMLIELEPQQPGYANIGARILQFAHASARSQNCVAGQLTVEPNIDGSLNPQATFHE
jgi:hypothetical protein